MSLFLHIYEHKYKKTNKKRRKNEKMKGCNHLWVEGRIPTYGISYVWHCQKCLAMARQMRRDIPIVIIEHPTTEEK